MGRIANIIIGLAKKKETTHVTPDFIVWNVGNFNTWFNHPSNGATYAHPGIFLRIDKLSRNHIHEYLKLCYGLSDFDEAKVSALYREIAEDWSTRRMEKHNRKKR